MYTLFDSSRFIYFYCGSSPVMMAMPTGEHCWKKNSGAPWARTSNLWIPSLTRSPLSYLGRVISPLRLEWYQLNDNTLVICQSETSKLGGIPDHLIISGITLELSEITLNPYVISNPDHHSTVFSIDITGQQSEVCVYAIFEQYCSK